MDYSLCMVLFLTSLYRIWLGFMIRSMALLPAVTGHVTELVQQTSAELDHFSQSLLCCGVLLSKHLQSPCSVSGVGNKHNTE
jgi:hypothetical protein